MTHCQRALCLVIVAAIFAFGASSAVAEEAAKVAQTLDERLVAVLVAISSVVSTVVAILKHFQAAKAEAGKSKAEKATDIVVAAVEEISKALPASKAKATKGAIQAAAEKAGCEDALNARVVKVTKGEIAVPADPATGLPKLAVLAVLVPFFGLGCVNEAVHENAVTLKAKFAIYERATVPDPRYDAAGQAKVKALGGEIDKTIDAIVRASE